MLSWYELNMASFVHRDSPNLPPISRSIAVACSVSHVTHVMSNSLTSHPQTSLDQQSSSSDKYTYVHVNFAACSQCTINLVDKSNSASQMHTVVMYCPRAMLGSAFQVTLLKVYGFRRTLVLHIRTDYHAPLAFHPKLT